MGQEAVHPGGLRSGRSADAKARVDAFDGAGGAIVQLVVRGFFRITGPEINVGFVPDLEVPLGDFVFAIASDKMMREILNELLPFAPILWRRDVLLVPERMKSIRIGGELPGHET